MILLMKIDVTLNNCIALKLSKYHLYLAFGYHNFINNHISYNCIVCSHDLLYFIVGHEVAIGLSYTLHTQL